MNRKNRFVCFSSKWLLGVLLMFSISVKAIALQDSALITITANNIPIEQVFRSIESQTNYSVFYNTKVINPKERVSVNVSRERLGEAMDKVLRGRNLKWVIRGTGIIIMEKSAVVAPAGGVAPVQVGNELAKDSIPRVSVSGRIVDPQGNPIPGATVSLRGQAKGQGTDNYGQFKFANIPANATFVISSIGYVTKQFKLSGQNEIKVSLDSLITEIQSFEVVSTGFQKIPKERATGSFYQLDNKILNRKISTNIIDRIDGVASGVLFSKNVLGGNNQPGFSVRGRSTIFANPNPLIILDNFPYEGDINNINPNDIESITILKDAAAASIWGAYSGNGVIVITTKKGRYNQPLKVTLNSSVTFGERPDVFYSPYLISKDYITAEKLLFDQGYYNSRPNDLLRPYISPAVEILLKKRAGTITDAMANTQLAELENNDTRKDIDKYVSRVSIFQQHSINLNGGGSNNQYFFSAGFDRNLQSVINNDLNRFTVSARNTFSLLKNKLEFTTGFIFTNTNISITEGANTISYGRVPYERLVDENGSPAIVGRDYRQSYIDTAGAGKLLNWNYKPLDELNNANNKLRNSDVRLSAGVKYSILSNLSLNVNYQFVKSASTEDYSYSKDSYYSRNLINKFTQINAQTGAISRPVPLGGILDALSSDLKNHNFRVQLNFDHTWNNHHTINAIAGYDIRSTNTNYNPFQRLYGYNQENKNSTITDFLNQYPAYYNPASLSLIPNNVTHGIIKYSLTDNNYSYYGNIGYSYKSKYIITGSARKDASNIFGVDINQKGTPLWSIGGSWIISNENFFRAKWISFLKLRVTNGYNGNVDKTTSAYVTTRTNIAGFYGKPTLSIQNPPNPSLRWEKINMTNFGVDFNLNKSIISGSIDFYLKKGVDLIGNSPLAPSSGITQFRGNTSDIQGKGIDIVLNTLNIDRKIKWSTTFLASYVSDKVTKYKAQQGTVSSYTTGLLNPLEGKPLYSMFSYKWAGLSAKGEPQGYSPTDKSITINYGTILNTSDINSLVYHGRSTPAYFGSLRNTLNWKNLEFSANIAFKAGYFFKRSFVEVFSGYAIYDDFSNRWKNPGDELTTSIPAFLPSSNPSRNEFYKNAEIHVERGDHIRLQDVQVAYDLGKDINLSKIQGVRLFAYMNNVGIIWKENKSGIDPDFVIGIPNPRTYAVGINLNF